MTKEELNVIDKLTIAHNAFVELKIQHPSDRREWEHHLHALQSIIMQRDAVRNHPNIFFNINI